MQGAAHTQYILAFVSATGTIENLNVIFTNRFEDNDRFTF